MDIHTEELLQQDWACAKKAGVGVEEHAEQQASVADAHAQEWLQQDLARVDKWVSSTMEHAEQRGLSVGTFEEEQSEVERSEHLGKDDIEKKSLST